MKKTKKILAVLLSTLLIGSAILTGCGSKESSADKKDKDPKEVTVGLSLSSLSNAFFIGMEKGVKDKTSEIGCKLIETNANGDIAKQLSDIEDLITKKVDILIVNALDADAIVPAVKKAKEANIPIIFLDRGANSEDMTTFLETDNVKMGEQAAELILKALKDKGLNGGNVVEIEGLQGTSAARDRGKGFHNVMDKHKEIKIVAKQAGDFNQEKSMNVMQNILQANPKIDAVFGHNDDCTVVAEKAIIASNRMKPVGDKEHIFVVGIDGINQAIESVKKGNIDVSISQDPIGMGAQAVEVGLKAIKGEQVEKHIYTKFFPITKDNAADENNWGNKVK
ncbi:sugar ABC transporter substrate-binding protein [Clostridium botulinum]